MLAGTVGLVIAAVGLIKGSVGKLRIANRKQAAVVFGASLAAGLIGSGMTPTSEVTTPDPSPAQSDAMTLEMETSTIPPTAPTSSTQPHTTTTRRPTATTTSSRPLVATTRTQPTAPPPVTDPPGTECDPSYPDFCIPPPPPDLDCGDIGRSFSVLQPDPHRFDGRPGQAGEPDGMGCESYN